MLNTWERGLFSHLKQINDVWVIVLHVCIKSLWCKQWFSPHSAQVISTLWYLWHYSENLSLFMTLLFRHTVHSFGSVCQSSNSWGLQLLSVIGHILCSYASVNLKAFGTPILEIPFWNSLYNGFVSSPLFTRVNPDFGWYNMTWYDSPHSISHSFQWFSYTDKTIYQCPRILSDYFEHFHYNMGDSINHRQSGIKEIHSLWSHTGLVSNPSSAIYKLGGSGKIT